MERIETPAMEEDFWGGPIKITLSASAITGPAPAGYGERLLGPAAYPPKNGWGVPLEEVERERVAWGAASDCNLEENW